MMNSGVISNGANVLNVVPPTAQVGLDIRISPHVDPLDIKSMLDGWCKECALTEGSVQWDFLIVQGVYQHATTSTDPSLNPWWGLFTSVVSSQTGIGCVPSVFPAATDSRFLRAMGVRAIGFSPMRRSPVLLHEHDEYIDISVFLEGCEVYIKVLSAMASQGSFSGFKINEF